MTHPTSSEERRLELLRWYCRRGMRLHPCYEILPDGTCACREATCDPANWGKHPRLGRWTELATSDFGQVHRWHLVWPTCNWGWALDEHLVLDDDPRNGGLDPERFFTEWEASFGFALPPTWTQLTGGGGLHLIYRPPEEWTVGTKLRQPNGRAIAGIDVKRRGGYILVEPSNHRSGSGYAWTSFREEDVEPPDELRPW